MPTFQHPSPSKAVASRVRQISKRLAELVAEVNELESAIGATSPTNTTHATRPFDFYERVRVSNPTPDNRELDNMLGTVLGRARAGQKWTYSVFIDAHEECWALSHKELSATGERDKKERFSGNSHIRVRVDDRGHGAIVKK